MFYIMHLVTLRQQWKCIFLLNAIVNNAKLFNLPTICICASNAFQTDLLFFSRDIYNFQSFLLKMGSRNTAARR